MNILKAKHLAKAYSKRPIVIDVSIEVKEGEVVGLLGPNGAGKTTCFYMIVGLVNQDHGQIFINGLDVSNLPMHKRAQKGLGYLPQEACVFRKLSVENNILAILQTRKNFTKAQQKEKLETLLEEFNIQHIRHSLGMALSGGERRRVEIARALAMDPAFILLDEPFAGVDPISVGDIKEIIKQLSRKGIGVLITDHNVRETLDICEKAYIVGNGHIIASGDAQSVLQNQLVKDIYLGEQFTL
ncbi:MAG: LPS export ABC transporter ATP-binding protein [Saccharospirillaceae bacterium]|nr:LPS export ABC transporter ATP-binding protein [Pseudomonadales bacterium]NRB79648.1 LPS export ABC transporter ATP-binding protein [Saccharospirillaceae bacterium]